jgi:hypothetical protein
VSTATGTGASALAARLDRQKIGAFVLEVTEMRPLRARAGWMHVTVSIRDRRGVLSVSSLMTGIISAGGRGVKPWAECRIFPTVAFQVRDSQSVKSQARPPNDIEKIDVRQMQLEEGIIALLGRLIPPGGHLMIDYENPGQEETFAELALRVPPAASHLGSIMFRAGFRGLFKDWYFSEGGHEGPRKLQANRPPDRAAARRALATHRRELSAFLKRPLPTVKADAAIVRRARSRARALLRSLHD